MSKNRAALVFTDPLEESDGAVREARRIYASTPGRYSCLDQYNNAFLGECGVSGLTIDPAAHTAIREHAVSAYPNECCGALVGREGFVSGTFQLPNTTREEPHRRFLVRASDYIAAERRAAASGLELIGFYHSHPDHPAHPSEYDLDHALPTFSYVIVSVSTGGPAEMTSWKLSHDRTAFCEETIQIRCVETRLV